MLTKVSEFFLSRLKMNGKASTEKEEYLPTNNGVLSTNGKPVVSFETGDEEYEPWKHRDPQQALGTPGALFHTIKSSMGSGILLMPSAFKNGGLWVSLVCAIFTGFICTHCIHILVYSSQVLCKRVRKPGLGYADTAEAAFATGPPRLRRYSAFVREFVDISLMVTYYFGVTVYIVFIASSLKQVLEANIALDLNSRYYVLMVSALVVPVGSIRSLKYLVPFSFFAIVFLVFGCGFVLYDIFLDLPPISSRPAFTDFQSLPLFYATVLYAMEGIGCVFPIENVMKKPDRFLGPFGVLNISMGFLVFMYALVGFFGFWRYGDSTEGSVTLNLNSSIIAQVVKILVALNVLCSYGLCFTLPSEILWRKLEPKVTSKNKTAPYYIMRVLLILGCVAIACALPDLEPFVGLCGALCYSTLGLLFPAVIEVVTFWGDDGYLGRGSWRLYKDLFLVFMWLVAIIAGTRASVDKVLETYFST